MGTLARRQRRPLRTGFLSVVTVVGLLLGSVACADDGSTSNAGRSRAPVTLTAPANTPEADLRSTAAAVAARLDRMGVGDAAGTVAPDGVEVTGSAGHFELEAAARQSSTRLTAVLSSAIGPCRGSGTPAVGKAQRCYKLGADVAGAGAIADATAVSSAETGWSVAFTVDPGQYQPFRLAVTQADASLLAVVADSGVLVAFRPVLPALRMTLGPHLTETQARRVAAALMVDQPLPIGLEAPPVPDLRGPRVNLDDWATALGVQICGTWLPNAPQTAPEIGLHSHNDGLVSAHPADEREAGASATLGLFLEGGGWQASADALRLWDGVTHQNGDRCADGRPGQLRWEVDGVEQKGDPSAWHVENGQVITLSFNSGSRDPGVPPQADALPVPSLRTRG